ncbi:phosphohistidine phosphatase SixA [Chamaesiphon sp.]|uniref:phosphohistidine phosphatase SixA n=1 Tax=Chamaesiphon sp. TaxID=2814140 RepID=UPI003593C6B9
MYLYLIRHGIAMEPDPLASDRIANDEARSLTKLGRKKVEQVAQRLEKLEVTFELIMTSPLVRAQQTADILIDNQIITRCEVNSDLKPMGDLHQWLTNWNARSDVRNLSTLALVGHEPNLSQWAELLIFGEVGDRLILKKGGIIGLKFADDRIAIGTAQLWCLLPPKLII